MSTGGVHSKRFASLLGNTELILDDGDATFARP